MRQQHALQRVIDSLGVLEAGFRRFRRQRIERIDQTLKQFMHHDMLGAQPIGDGLEPRALLRQRGEDGVVLDGMVCVDDLAVLTAEIAEKQARSIRYQMTVAKLPLAKDIEEFDFTGTPINEGLVRELANGSFVADQRNEPLYNPTMLRSELLTVGPIGVGSQFHAETTMRGRRVPMTIEITAFDAQLKPGEWNIVLGIELARLIGARVGDKVTLVAPGGSRMSITGSPSPAAEALALVEFGAHGSGQLHGITRHLRAGIGE